MALPFDSTIGYCHTTRCAVHDTSMIFPTWIFLLDATWLWLFGRPSTVDEVGGTSHLRRSVRQTQELNQFGDLCCSKYNTTYREPKAVTLSLETSTVTKPIFYWVTLTHWTNRLTSGLGLGLITRCLVNISADKKSQVKSTSMEGPRFTAPGLNTTDTIVTPVTLLSLLTLVWFGSIHFTTV